VIRLAVQVLYGDNDDNLLVRGVELVNDAVREAEEPAPPVLVVERLPRARVHHDPVNRPAKLDKESAPSSRRMES
jgi:hypothetical protein